MPLWEQVIADTIQMGGVLVFLKDDAPSDFSQWLLPLQTQLVGEVPFAVRSIGDLSSGKYKTRSEDLIFFFESQEKHVEMLNAVLQGQRLLFASRAEGHRVDFIWDQITLKVWTETLTSLKNHLVRVGPLREREGTQETPCLFLDRDDVVVRNVPYNNDPNKVELMPGVVNLLRQAHEKGLWVALVTNQSGLGRGRISWREYKKVHQRMLELLAAQGCWIDECVWASFIENEAVIEGRLLASLRKPRAGMFQLVHEKLRVQMSQSLMVGDSATDLIAAHSAGVGKLYLLHSEKFSKEEAALKEYQKLHVPFQYQAIQNFSELSL